MSQSGGPGAALRHEAVASSADLQVGQFAECLNKSAHHGQRLDTNGEAEADKSKGQLFFVCFKSRALCYLYVYMLFICSYLWIYCIFKGTN